MHLGDMNSKNAGGGADMAELWPPRSAVEKWDCYIRTIHLSWPMLPITSRI